MLTLGLTGPSGSGKGVLGRFFQAHRIPVLDTDAIYHELIGAPSPCTEELVSLFGSTVENEAGGIDRPALAALVLGDSEENRKRRLLLNGIAHKYVLSECRRLLSLRKAEGARAAVIDAPLLYESGFDRECSHVIAVLAPASARLSRIMSRDGLTEEQALLRMRSQPSEAFYRSRADFVVENGGTEEALFEKASALLHSLSLT